MHEGVWFLETPSLSSMPHRGIYWIGLLFNCALLFDLVHIIGLTVDTNSNNSIIKQLFFKILSHIHH